MFRDKQRRARHNDATGIYARSLDRSTLRRQGHTQVVQYLAADQRVDCKTTCQRQRGVEDRLVERIVSSLLLDSD